MARYPHIPGIPLMGPGGLHGLTRASEFVTMPRAPVRFLQNARRPAQAAAAAANPRASYVVVPPGAPRRVAFRDAPVSSLPFPPLTRPATRPPSPSPPPLSPPVPSPLRFTYWTTPSLSKQGVRRAYINRRLPVYPPSPVSTPSRIPFPKSCLMVAPRKEKTLGFPIARSMDDALRGPGPPTPCKPRVPNMVRFASAVDRSHAPSMLPVRSGSGAPRSASSLRSILVQPQAAGEVRAKKSVRFGDATVREVDFWIDRKKHVFEDPEGLWRMGRLQGWRVTPLPKPDEDGETEKYMTMWGSDHSNLKYHTNMPDCGSHGCVWKSISLVYIAYLRKGVNLWSRHDLILYAWSELRERDRQKGLWRL